MTSVLLTPNKCCKLSPMIRVGFGAFIISHVAEHFSSYFRRTFRQNACVRLAWKFASGNGTAPQALNSLFEELLELSDRAEAEGYDWPSVAMGAGLVEEMIHQNGKGIAGAVDCAACSFKALTLFRHGIGIHDHRLAKHVEIVDAMETPLRTASLHAFKFAQGLTDGVTASTFSAIRLPVPSAVELPVPLQEIARDPRREWQPPRHECSIGRNRAERRRRNTT